MTKSFSEWLPADFPFLKEIEHLVLSMSNVSRQLESLLTIVQNQLEKSTDSQVNNDYQNGQIAFLFH